MANSEWGQRVVCPSLKAETEAAALQGGFWEMVLQARSPQRCESQKHPGRGFIPLRTKTKPCFNQNTGNWGRVVCGKRGVREGSGWGCLVRLRTPAASLDTANTGVSPRKGAGRR